MLSCYTHSLAWLYIGMGLIDLGLFAYLRRYGTRSSTITWYRTWLLLGGLSAIAHGAGGLLGDRRRFQLLVRHVQCARSIAGGRDGNLRTSLHWQAAMAQ